MAKVVIIGAGWLGLPLAKSLVQKGYQVLATKRDESACQTISELEGITAVPYQLGTPLPDELCKADIYVINIAGGRQGIDKAHFSADMQVLLQACSMHAANVLFVSTTSVYGERQRIIDEQSPPEPITDSAIAHVDIENWLRKHDQQRATILRLAGLVGEDRHPVYHLAGQQGITAANKVVNLVHREDVIAAIETILEQRYWGHTLHLCSTEHPTRKDYYTWAAEQLHLEAPVFFDESQQEPAGKRIDASQSLQKLGLRLKYASPYMMIPGAQPPDSQC